MDIFFSTGERSGDQMAKKIISALQEKTNYSLKISGVTGPESSSTGLSSILDYTPHAVTGGVGDYWREVFDPILDMLKENPPKVFIGITHHAFNVPLVRELKQRNIKAIMIGPPEEWAWDARFAGKLIGRLLGAFGRILRKFHLFHKINSTCIVADYATHRAKQTLELFDEIICLFPMGYDYYKSAVSKEKIYYYGLHLGKSQIQPLDEKGQAELRLRLGLPLTSMVLGIFPGSRPTEITKHLETALKASQTILSQRPDLHAIISVVDPRIKPYIQEKIDEVVNKNIKEKIIISSEHAERLLSITSFGILCSGTLTMQASLMGVRGCVIYNLYKQWQRQILSLLVKQKNVCKDKNIGPFFALPNAVLLHGNHEKEIEYPYKEFVFSDFADKKISDHILEKIGEDPIINGICVPQRLSLEIVQLLHDSVMPKTRENGESWESRVAENILKFINNSDTILPK